LLGIPRHLTADGFAKLGDADTQLLENGNNDPFVLGEERQEEMQIVDERISGAPSEIDRFVERFTRFYSQSVRIDHEGWP
jgi:hypothetical protein